MNERISKISFIVFVVLLVPSLFLLSAPGNSWPWYAVMSVFAAVPLAVGPGRYRRLGAMALVLSGVLMINDIVAGRQFWAQYPAMRR